MRKDIVSVSDLNRLEEQSVEVTVDTQTQEEESAYLYEQLYEKYPDLLVLVNKEQALSESYEPELTTICSGRLQASQWLYEDLEEMLAAAKKEGYGYWIASAYRSRSYQQKLVDDDVAKYMQEGMTYEQALEKTYEATMPAGHSEHETGLALDILCDTNSNMDETQADEPGNQWLIKNCWKYGFVLRYPEDKTDVTKIEYEPWHFRYVGREAAEFLHENEMVLEEFFSHF